MNKLTWKKYISRLQTKSTMSSLFLCEITQDQRRWNKVEKHKYSLMTNQTRTTTDSKDESPKLIYTNLYLIRMKENWGLVGGEWFACGMWRDKLHSKDDEADRYNPCYYLKTNIKHLPFMHYLLRSHENLFVCCHHHQRFVRSFQCFLPFFALWNTTLKTINSGLHCGIINFSGCREN